MRIPAAPSPAKSTLDPGESRTVLFLLGMKSSAEAAAITDSYTDPAGQVRQEINALKADWYAKLDHLKINTPDPRQHAI